MNANLVAIYKMLPFLYYNLLNTKRNDSLNTNKNLSNTHNTSLNFVNLYIYKFCRNNVNNLLIILLLMRILYNTLTVKLTEFYFTFLRSIIYT